ncbi:MAG TPA: exodeoxyribonuclease VII large subunit, partial [Anaerolineaceae bacterium]|nr:exodeoxyribonuclease VII large subunit [Anaerolineaceae bacterium]
MDQPSLFVPQPLTVSDLTRHLRALLEGDPVLQDVWVMGEVSNLSRPSSGHIYFTLKDDRAALRCVIWRNAAQRMGHLLQNGLAVEAHGEISLYERDGNYQLYIDALRPAGEGALYREFLRLKARLEAEGLFDPERKRSLPDRPTRIGIVTSPTGAALQDMLNTIRRRWVLADVLVSPCAVQGAEAPGEIVTALKRLASLSEPPQVILIARGGGSLEDLWAFNDEQVVRAIADSPIPTITGIGHETDFTLADFAADQRAPTPTGAAEMATPDSIGERQALMQVDRWLTDAYLQAVQSLRGTWLALQNRLDRLNPRAGIRNEQQRVDSLAERLRL